jgi:hypothetical protein
VRFRILESFYDPMSNKTSAHVEQGGVKQWFEVSGKVSKEALPGLLKYSVEKYFTNPAGKRRSRGNPAAGAVQAYEEFHGRKPDEFVTVKRKIHMHRHLAGAGELRMIKVQSVDGKSIVKLSRFGDALLAFNEDKNQLFIEGGSQSVDLKAFGIRTQHEVETLGKVVMLDYFTRKDHLGEDGGTAIYRHKFRTVNQDGRPVIVRILRYPDLIYFVRDKHLVFSGGDYEILAEGIDK